ncbi:MAG TPA: hypothetical protein VMQ60_09290 [Acidobacteriaceae bacterium]|nr:hypothetical protein [Acidobacteriaceae bacterium]
MAKVTLYKPDGNVFYQNVSNIRVEDGVLTFESKGHLDFKGVKVTATVPFVVEEETEGGL